MMKTETTFKYADLGERAQERAREWMRECIMQDWEPDYDDIQECLACLGFRVHQEDVKTVGGKTRQRPAISYSISWAQGDYASFAADWDADEIDPARLAEHAPQDETLRTACAQLTAIMLARPQAYAVVKGHDNRAHEIDCFPGPDEDGDITPIEGPLHIVVNDLAHWMYTQMRDDLEYQTSDEALVETIEANEYDFDEDGRRA